jgi:flagellar motor switch protein FliN/FliY
LSSVPGEIYLLSAGQDITAAGNHVMVAVGVEDSSAEELRSTFLELVNQAFAMLARSMTARLGREVLPANGRVDATAANPASLEAVQWGSIQFTLGELTATLFVGVPKGMLDAFATEAKPAAQAAAASAPGDRGTASPAAHQTAGESKTFELLLDVELPVSVSFGHALVPLKEVLKLTTGSIVELSRAIVEPVDVVVNNCVIARGEVVVVEGNFGVRIQHVVSRSDRLRTLQ